MAYKNFSKYVLRTPLFSFSFYKKLTRNLTIDDDDLREVCSDNVVKEAIFLASPVLYYEMEKWLKGDLSEKSSRTKLVSSLIKYLSRMSSRCTPFGLFAGTAVGTFAEETNICLTDKSKNRRHTRLDMNYLVALSQDLSKDPNIRKQLLFYPNSSIYITGHQLRYVEYSYLNSRRIHQIVAIDSSHYIDKVLHQAKNGMLPKDLALAITDDEVSLEDATNFVDQLIENQLLISELEPSVSGPEFMDQILLILKKLKGTEDIVDILGNTQKDLSQLDSKLGNTADGYIQLSERLKGINTGFELKYLFQTDMQLSAKNNTIDTDTIKKIKKALHLFNRISPTNINSSMDAFKSAFYSRYEDREVALSHALDVELGLGYLQGQDSGDLSPLLDGLDFPDSKEQTVSINRSDISSILRKKLTQCLIQNDYILHLHQADFDHLEENWDNLPDTICSLVEKVVIEGEEKTLITGSGGPNGAILLGRFCHGDSEIWEFTKEIIAMENEMNPDKVLAEIIHLPEARVGNVLIRPDFRKYEIPYLAKSILDQDNQVELEDLMISTRPGQPVKIRSKKLGKEILPCLTVAHNFSQSSLPIYEFLANAGNQGGRNGVGFKWPKTLEEYDFLPRVEYEDVIVSRATWNLKRSDIQPYLSPDNHQEQKSQEALDFFIKKNLPQFVSLVEGDNELLVNTKNISSVNMLFETVRNRETFQLKEFLHSEPGPIKGEGGHYSNQIVIAFYNDNKLKAAKGL